MILCHRRKAIILLLFSLCSASTASSADWKQFVSSSGFSVTYPATWFPIGASDNRLQILSSRGGAEGIVIKRGQAEIIVIELRGPATATLSELVKEDTRGEVAILSRRDIRNGIAGNTGCGDLTEVVSKQEAVPPKDVPISVPYIVNTDFYCEIGGRKFSALVKNWEGDKQQRYYQQIALKMIKSLRVSQ